jgi:hypothetical protein
MLTLRPCKDDELEAFKRLEDEHHEMGTTHSGGDTMRLIVEEDGHAVALMVWGSGSYRLKERDEYVGWTPALRASRQKLVVCNRRFTLLVPAGTRPNLASQILGLAVRELPGLWLKRFGYVPLLAETFCDIEAHAGTCYKAAGWTPLGKTRGFSRTRQSRDWYVPNGRPKTLWVKELRPDARELMLAPHPPAECAKACDCDSYGVLPLALGPSATLHEALSHVPDPRRSNRHFLIGTMLTLATMGMMSGAWTLSAIVRFCNRLTIPQRKQVGLPRAKGGSYRPVPSYKAFYNLLRQLDPDEYAKALTAWLSAHAGTLPRQLALDGKFLPNALGVVTAWEPEEGRPLGVAFATAKEGDGEHCELRTARKLLSWMPLENATVTADALHCQNETAQEIVARGGEYLLQAKNNRKAVLDAARRSAAAAEAAGTGEKTTRPTPATAASNAASPSSARSPATP